MDCTVAAAFMHGIRGEIVILAKRPKARELEQAKGVLYPAQPTRRRAGMEHRRGASRAFGKVNGLPQAKNRLWRVSSMFAAGC